VDALDPSGSGEGRTRTRTREPSSSRTASYLRGGGGDGGGERCAERVMAGSTFEASLCLTDQTLHDLFRFQSITSHDPGRIFAKRQVRETIRRNNYPCTTSRSRVPASFAVAGWPWPAWRPTAVSRGDAFTPADVFRCEPGFAGLVLPVAAAAEFIVGFSSRSGWLEARAA